MTIGETAVEFENELFRARERIKELEAVIANKPGEWVSVDDRLPELKDDSVLAVWDHGGYDMVHIEDYFSDITAGISPGGEQLYTKMYISSGITHWMHYPDLPK